MGDASEMLVELICKIFSKILCFGEALVEVNPFSDTLLMLCFFSNHVSKHKAFDILYIRKAASERHTFGPLANTIAVNSKVRWRILHSLGSINRAEKDHSKRQRWSGGKTFHLGMVNQMANNLEVLPLIFRKRDFFRGQATPFSVA